MIVVAIIGALAAIAMPQFSIFLKRAKQTQAKFIASNFSSAQKIFHAEWGTYFNDFRDIGYAPEGDYYYDIWVPSIVTLPSNYPKATIAGFGGSSGAGQALAQGGYGRLYGYCNGGWGVPSGGHPKCQSSYRTSHGGFFRKQKYFIVIKGDLDGGDTIFDRWNYCENYSISDCPASGSGLKLMQDDTLY